MEGGGGLIPTRFSDVGSVELNQLSTSSGDVHVEMNHDYQLMSTSSIYVKSKKDGDDKSLEQDRGESTALCHACASGNKDGVLLLINEGANIFISDRHGDLPLHIAIRHSHTEIVKALLETGLRDGHITKQGAKVNCVNKDLHTPLHLACIGDHGDTARFLVEHGCDVTLEDYSGLNALQLAVNHDSFNSLMILLNTTGLQPHIAKDVLIWSAEQNKAQAFKMLLHQEVHIPNEIDDAMLTSFMMNAVKNNYKDIVLVMLRWKRSIVESVDELGNTPLHYASDVGYNDIIKELLRAKPPVDVRNCALEGEQTPLHMAASEGRTEAVHLLLNSASNINQTDLFQRTPLHLASMNGNIGVVELLLFGKSDVTQTADITLCDASEESCLDYAIDNGHEKVVRMIIKHERWREVMKASSLDKETNYQTTPMRKLISHMPGMARLVLDRCITVKKDKRNVDVEFYYEFLEDSYSTWMRPSQQTEDLKSEENTNDDDGLVNEFLRRVYRPITSNQSIEADQYDSDHRLKKDATSYITDPTEKTINHPLFLMVSSPHMELLDHPLVTTFLQHKWNAIARYVFLSTLSLYLFFLGMLTGYIVIVPPNFYIKSSNRSIDPPDIVWFADGEERWVHSVQRSTLVFFDQFGPAVIVALSALNLFREIVQMVLQRLAYFKNMDNYLELFLYIAAILFALPFSEVEYVESGHIKKDWQWQCGAVAGFFGWINLLLFIRGNSKLGIYVIMFIDIICTFLKFAIILVLFIMAFGLAFYALLMNQNPFNRLGYSLAKTFVMMIGELDYASIFFAQDYLGTQNTRADGDDTYFLNAIFFKGLTYVFFCTFLVVMAILMMNMLVGLAVDDIQAIQKKANLHRLKLQVESVMGVQTNFPFWVWRSSIIRQKTFHLRDIKIQKWLQRLVNVRKQLKRAVEIGGSQQDFSVAEESEETYGKIHEKIEEMVMKMDQLSKELLEREKKRDVQMNELQKAHDTLNDRCDILKATQERFEDH
nr:transient receptor potential cation channel subfamily A member 1 homolog [Lytechinus pictus]